MAKQSGILNLTPGGGNTSSVGGPARPPLKISSTGQVKTPAAVQATAVANFNTRWQTRVQALGQVKGINLDQHVKPIYEMDMQRVKKGQKAFTNAQVIDFVSGLMKKQALVKKQDNRSSGPLGFIGNIGKDVGDIAGSLNPINLAHQFYQGAMGANAALGRVIGDVGGLAGKKGGGNTEFTNLWNEAQSWIPGYSQTARNVDKTFQGLTQREEKGQSPVKLAGEGLQTIRGVNLIPGAYTAGNLMQGKPGELAKHPVFTLLDVLPFAAKGGEAIATAKFGEEEVAAAASKTAESSIIPKGSAWEALAQGNPLKAATRAIDVPFTGKSITGPDSIAEFVARRAGVSEDVRNLAARQMRSLREGAVYEKYKTLKDAYLERANRRGVFLEELKNRLATGAHLTDIQAQLDDVQSRIKTAEETPGWEPTNMMKGEEKRLQGELVNATTKLRDRIAVAERQFKKATDDVHRVASSDMIEYAWKNNSLPEQQILDDFKSQGFTPEEAQTMLDNNYRNLSKWANSWMVDARFKRWIERGNVGEDFKNAYIPRYITDAMDKLNKRSMDNALGRGYRGATQIFRYAVMVGPRHSIHVAFSNGMFMALDDMGNFKPSVIRQAFSAAHDPQAFANIGLQEGIGTFSGRIQDELERYKTEEIHGIAQAKTLARLAKTIGGIFDPRNYRKLEEFMTNMSRAMVYFNEHDKALARDPEVAAATSELGKGIKTSMNLGKAVKAAEPLAHEEGLMAATRVLMDVDHMSPVERTVMRQIMPFYPFTRQLLRYMVKYPAEHPFKAAVLAAVGRMEMQDAQSGLPLKFMNLFPITGADNNGNQIFIDTKNMNPFRSMNGLSPWTLAGFMSELNPLITTPAQAAGLNILTATPELYPQLTVDPVSGDFVATHDPMKIAETTATAIVPEANTLLGVTGLSSNLSSLRQSDPNAYRQLLFSSLNLPFVPADKNLAQERVKFMQKQFTVAQQDTNAAVKAGDLSSLNYGVVPYKGKLYTVQELKKQLAGG